MQSLNQSILGEYNTLGKRQTEQIYGPNGIHKKNIGQQKREGVSKQEWDSNKSAHF
jgi:hypothetical protein